MKNEFYSFFARGREVGISFIGQLFPHEVSYYDFVLKMFLNYLSNLKSHVSRP